jgi:hypothetical protein
MPVSIFLNLPLIVWMGAVQILRDAMQDERLGAQRMPDPDDLLTNRENVIAFPPAFSPRPVALGN